MSVDICHFGNVLDVLPRLAADGLRVQTCVTSPPYFGLRDYGRDGQIGLEQTPQEYVQALVDVFRGVREVLADDGTIWVNLGDTYAQNGGPGWQRKNGQRADRRFTATRDTVPMRECRRRPPVGLKPKDLIGIPWRVAFALQEDGWYLRSDIIWHKPNPMPESVTDRPTKAHEYLFLLSMSERYYYDSEAIKEPVKPQSLARINQATFDSQTGGEKDYGKTGTNANRSMRKTLENFRASGNKERKPRPGAPDQHGGEQAGSVPWEGRKANKRTVWTVPTKPYRGAHFATFPPALIEPCILAGSRPGDIVLDPFLGSGTTAQVAQRLGRRWVGVELNNEYAGLIHGRTAQGGLRL